MAISTGAKYIPRIKFIDDDSTALGTLKFLYPTDPKSIVDPIEIPTVNKRWFSEKEPIGILWLFELAQGTLAQK